MIVGEAGGHDEDRRRAFFVGKTGLEMDNYLNRVGIPRSRCWITNVIKCCPAGNRDPKAEEVQNCSSIIEQEILDANPRFIATLGRHATRYFLGDVDMEAVHGIPHHWNGRIIIPVYHPAAGLHDTANMSNIMADFIAVKDTMMGKLPIRTPGHHDEPPPYHLVEYGEDITPFLDSTIAVDTETQDEQDTPWCVQFCCGDLGHVVMWDNIPSLIQLGEHMANPDILSVIHNSLFDLKVLSLMDITPANFVDTMVMAYLLQTEPQGLKPLTFRHLNVKMNEYEDVVGPKTEDMAMEYIMKVAAIEWPKLEPRIEMKAGKPTIRQPQTVNQRIKRILTDMAGEKDVVLFDRWHLFKPKDGRAMVEEKFGKMRKAYLKDVDHEVAMQYAATDPWATYYVYQILKQKIDAMELHEALDRDVRVIPMVEDMQRAGMLVNPDHFIRLRTDFEGEMERVTSTIQAMCGSPDFYPGSDKQVFDLLLKRGTLNPKKRTVNGKVEYVHKKATDVKALELLKDKDPIVPQIMRFKVLDKLVDSFIEPLLSKRGPDNRIHTTLRVTRVVTGRLASSNPNLMAIPTRSEDGRKIRGGFIAPKGFRLVSGDQSQVEMRVVAHLSQDKKMLDIFNTGKDIHAYTASDMFGIPIDQLDEMEHRYPAKRVGFGILNLISAAKLLLEMEAGGAKGWTEAKCQVAIDRWFNIYEGVKAYTYEAKAEARRTGMVRDIAGRFRLVPEVLSVHRSVSEAGLRQAVNAPIQMSAQAIEKEAMAQCIPIYRSGMFPKGWIRPLIQIHDDVVWEIKEEIVSEVIPIIKYTMEHCMDDRLTVPLKVDFKTGEEWENMEKYKV